MAYKAYKLRHVVRIQAIHSLHYFETAGGFASLPERHGFWEMVYVDRGEPEVSVGDNILCLKQGQAVLLKPNEIHSISTPIENYADFFIISFDSSNDVIETLCNKILTLSLEEKWAIMALLREGGCVFGPLLDICYIAKLKANPEAPFGGEQLVGLYLVELLILMLRHQEVKRYAISNHKLVESNEGLNILLNTKNIMHMRLDGSLRFEDICRYLGLSSTALKVKFKKAAGMGVMQYYQKMRISEARRMLRGGTMNISQVSELLGYSSLQVFSRRFKQDAGVSPTQYLKMIADSIPENVQDEYDSQ